MSREREPTTNNVLYMLGYFVRERGASVRFDRLLHLGAVLNGCRLVRVLLRIFWIGMLVLGSLSLDIARYRQVKMPHVIVPFEGYATK